MRSSLLAVMALFVSGMSFAQGQDVTLSVTTIDAEPVIKIGNNSNRVVTAFVATVDIPGDRRMWARIYYDAYVNWRRDIPIPAGGSAQLPVPHVVGGSSRPACNLEAVLFSDGTSAGTPNGLRDLIRRRQIILARLQEITTTLRYISERKLARDEAALLLGQKRYARAAETAVVPFEERLLHDLTFALALRNINDLRVDGKVPDGSVAVWHLTRVLDRWRTYVESAKPTSFAPLTSGALSPRPQPSRPGSARLVSAELGLPPASVLHSRPYLHASARPPSCSAHDNATHVIEGPDTCGNKRFELIATVDGTQYNVGTAWAFGVCTGGYTHCNGFFIPQGREEGGKFFNIDGSTPSGQVGFYWVFENWNAEYFDCDCTDVYPQGSREITLPWYYPTPVFYAQCP